MATYTTITGDTFELISRKQYGTEQEASRIERANPGLLEPLTGGVTVIIPPLPEAPQDRPQELPSDRRDEVALLIDGIRFRFWTAVRITRAIDAMDTIQFSAPFEPDAPGFKETFRPFSFKPLRVTVGGEPLFTGTMVLPLPNLQATSATLQVSGYSTPGVLNDCTFPSSAYPIEYNDLTLQDIATAAAGVFGLNVVFDDDPGPIFEQVGADPGAKVLSFLSGLAKQRNFIITSTTGGELQFLKSINTGRPVAVLQQGEFPVTSVTPLFTPQDYYSHITGLVPTAVGVDGPQFTVKNPYLTDTTRPFTFNAEDIADSEIKAAVDSKIGRMFGSAATYAVSVTTWRDPSGALWEPNTTIKLQAPSAMIYSSYEFLIRSVEFTRDGASESAVLNLVLPGAYSGETPEALPWD